MYKPKYIMMTAGPTRVRENVMEARSEFSGNPDLDNNFFDFYEEVCKKIARVFKTTKSRTIIMNGEGMLGLDSVCASLTEKGDKVLVISNGIFGAGFKDLCEIYGADVYLYSESFEETIDVQKLENFLKDNHDFKYATLVHCDTPSGVLNDAEKICKLLKSYGIITVLDTISAVGGTELKVDEWSVDIAIGASQKVFSVPSGLTFMTISEDAWEIIEKRDNIASFYCNLKLWGNVIENKMFPYTMPASDIMALNVALDNMIKEGLEFMINRHEAMAEYVRESLIYMGLELYLKNGYSPTVTAFKVPENYNGDEIRKIMLEKHNVMLSSSYGELEGKVIRIGHMGESSYPPHLKYTLASLEETLAELKNKYNNK